MIMFLVLLVKVFFNLLDVAVIYFLTFCSSFFLDLINLLIDIDLLSCIMFDFSLDIEHIADNLIGLSLRDTFFNLLKNFLNFDSEVYCSKIEVLLLLYKLTEENYCSRESNCCKTRHQIISNRRFEKISHKDLFFSFFVYLTS